MYFARRALTARFFFSRLYENFHLNFEVGEGKLNTLNDLFRYVNRSFEFLPEEEL